MAPEGRKLPPAVPLASRAVAAPRMLLLPSALPGRLRLAATTALSLAIVFAYGTMLEFEAGAPHAAPLVMAVFSAAIVASVAGFAFSALCGALLFHLPLDHVQIVQTMMVCSVCIQLLSVSVLRGSIGWTHLKVFLAGGVVGLPLGLAMLLMVERSTFAAIMGVLLCGYAAIMLSRRRQTIARASRGMDFLVGLCGGVTGGIMAFPGAPVTIWCQMKGWTRDQQRGVFQPFILLMQLAALALMAAGSASGPAVPLPAIGWLAIPPALLGAVIGLRIYRGMSDRRFADSINILLLVSGALLLLTR